MKVTKSGSAVWRGELKSGTGSISTESGALSDSPYGFASRFEGKQATNPEELIGAAHAGCFNMALAMILGQAKLVPEQLETTAAVTLEKVEDGFAITHIELTLKAKVPGANQQQFQTLATSAKENCPLSKLFNAEVTLESTLID